MTGLVTGNEYPVQRTAHKNEDITRMGVFVQLLTYLPETCTGKSLVGDDKRDYFFGEFGNEAQATRMLTDGQFKLIYYATGNVMHLFDTKNDPNECDNLIDNPDFADKKAELTAQLIHNMHDDDNFFEDGQLVGLPDKPRTRWADSPALGAQRGLHFPMPR